MLTPTLRGELGLLGTGRLLQPGPELLGGPQRGGGPHQELPVSAALSLLWEAPGHLSLAPEDPGWARPRLREGTEVESTAPR